MTIDVQRIPSFDGTFLAVDVDGTGPAVVLLHGFLIDGNLNWRANGFAAALVDAGYTAVVPDARGHGRSDRPHDPARYTGGALERDVLAILDHLGLDDIAIIGYSMGADTAARVATRRTVRCLVLGGVGGDLSDPPDLDRSSTANALRTGDPDSPDPMVALAQSLGADSLAAAALFEGIGHLQPPEFLSVHCPVLVIAGDRDDMAGGTPASLARRYPRGEAVTIPDADHLTASFDPLFTSTTIEFLNRTLRDHSSRRPGQC